MEVQAKATPGTIALNQVELKLLRQQLGLSQEMLAQMCLERRLCISLASVKRAEAGKRVLYRTARHMAEFYGVSLGSLMPHADGKSITRENSGRNILCITISHPHDSNLLLELLRDEVEKFGGRVDRL